jgi:hypothetical protein
MSIHELWYPRTGMDRYGHPVAPPQPTTLHKTATEPYAQLAFSDTNMNYLQRRVRLANHGKVSYETLLRFVDNAVMYYRERWLTPTYGPSTRDELQQALDIINRRALGEVMRQLRAQQNVQQRWLTEMHHPAHTFIGQPTNDRAHDAAVESFLF